MQYSMSNTQPKMPLRKNKKFIHVGTGRIVTKLVDDTDCEDCECLYTRPIAVNTSVKTKVVY